MIADEEHIPYVKMNEEELELPRVPEVCISSVSAIDTSECGAPVGGNTVAT